MAVSAAESNGSSHDTEALYREHGAAVAALCRSLLRDRTDTEDATQQVFLSAHRALLNGAAPREPRAWLLAVARHECYARFRERASTPVPSGDAPEQATADASVQVLRAGELASVWDEVGRMPPAQREVFLLREIRGLSYGQLADELSLSGSSVRSLLLRARTRLRQRLGDVAAGLGGAPWVQALLRLFAGGDGTSPVPAATKAAAVGIGALALAGSGGLAARHAVQTPRHTAEHRQAAARVQRVAVPAVVAVAPREDRRSLDDRGSEVERARGRDGGDRGRGSRSSGESSNGHDGSDDTAAVLEPSTDGPSGGGGSSSGPGPGDGSGSVTTAASSDSGSGGPGPSNSGSSESDSSGSSGGSHGSEGGGGSDGGSGHDG